MKHRSSLIPEGLPRAESRLRLLRALGRAPGSALVVLMASGCGTAETKSPPIEIGAQVTQVRLAPVTDTSIVQPVVASGVLGAKEEIPLGFKIGGVIGRIEVEEGEVVKAGQLLATLELPEIAGAVAKAQAGLDQAERDLARADALYADSVIPRTGWEGAKTAAQVAQADLDIARFNQRYAAIRAPSSGTVLRRSAEPGQQISGGTVVLILASAGRGQVIRVGLADRDVARVSLGDRATIRFQLGTGVVPGRVSQIAAQASPGTGTWSVEVALDRPQPATSGGVASGLIGAVEISPKRADAVRLIPIQALLEGDGDSAEVFTLAVNNSDTTAVRRRVSIAFLSGEQAAVSGGLEGVGEVVTDGAAYLQDGERVHPTGAASTQRRGGL